MNRGSMSKQVTKAPGKPKPKGYKNGGAVKCSPRKAMAMGKK